MRLVRDTFMYRTAAVRYNFLNTTREGCFQNV